MKNTRLKFQPPKKREYSFSVAANIAFTLAREKNLSKVYDFGCGYGHDIKNLSGKGLSVSGHDPFFYKVQEPVIEKIKKADIILLSYILNVLPEDKRTEILLFLKTTTKKNAFLIVVVPSGRLYEKMSLQAKKKIPFSDGFLSERGFFNRAFSESELSEILSGAGFKVLKTFQTQNKYGVVAICLNQED